MTRIILQLVMLIPSIIYAPMAFFVFWSMLLSGTWLNYTLPFLRFSIIGLIGLIVSVFLKSNKARTSFIYILYAALFVGILAAIYGFARGTFLSGIKNLAVSAYFIPFITYASAVCVAVWNLIRLMKYNPEVRA